MPAATDALDAPEVHLAHGALGWPAALDDLADPPPLLHCAARTGALPSLARAVAIVGTRRATPLGRARARALAAALARAGCVVILGGAFGIDAAAHEGALDVDAPSIAVLGTPLDRPYPAAHLGLFRALVARGAVVSELTRGEPVHPGRFLARNRLVAALARGVVVVEAPARSGALATAEHAFRLGRPVLAVPHAPDAPEGAGGVALLVNGRAQAVRDAHDVLTALGLAPLDPSPGARSRGARRTQRTDEHLTRTALHATERTEARALGPDARAVLDVLDRTPAHADALAARSGLPIGRVHAALLALSLEGAVLEAAGTFVRVR